MTYKNVKYLVPAYEVDMGGIKVKQCLPTNNIAQVDPFLLLHHAKQSFTSDAPAIQQGLGPHPHRGFSPVTFVIEGEVHHRDSRGNNQIAKKGEVQWMHAGAGIIHSERPSQHLADRNGLQEVIQLWINSPSHKKTVPPNYQYVPESEIPVFFSEDKQVVNKLIAGTYGRLKGKINPESELLIVWSEAPSGGSQSYSTAESFNSMLYLIDGELKIEGYGIINKECLVIFNGQAGDIHVSARSESQFLLLAGEALNEKVVHHGPFVMNSETEILEAMRDYQKGKMGLLIEEK